MLMQSIKNYELVLSSEESEDSARAVIKSGEEIPTFSTRALWIITGVEVSRETVLKKLHFRSSDSTIVTEVCGRAIARTKPGNPAPEPKSSKLEMLSGINLQS